MKLLYSLLISFLIVTSLFSTPNDECQDLEPPYRISFNNLTNNDCLKKAYYPEGTSYDCGSSSMTKHIVSHESAYCGGDSSKANIITESWNIYPISQCPEGESPDSDGICYPTPCDSSDPLADCNGDGVPNGQDPDNDEDGNGIPDKCDSTSSNYANYDCDGDGDNNAEDPDPNNPDVNKDSQASGQSDSENSDCDNYQVYRENFSDTGWIKFGNYQHISCWIDDLNNYFYDGLNRYISRMDSLVCKPDCTGFVKMCPSGKLYSSIKGYCVSFNEPIECVETNNNKMFRDGDRCYKEFYCEDGSVYDNQLVICPDSDENGQIDDNISIQSNGQSTLQALTDYGVSTNAAQVKILSELEAHTQKISNIDTKFDSLLSKTDKSNDSLKSIDSKIDSLVSSNNLVKNSLNSIDGKLISSLSNDNRRDDLLLEIKNSIDDLNTSSSFSPDSSLYSVEQDELENSLLSLDGLKDDFTDFKNNVLNDLSTTSNSFDNAKNLFDGSLQLNSISASASCSESAVLMGETYSLDLCEIVTPFNNVIYTFFYMLGFFSILITFAYIFVLKGVD